MPEVPTSLPETRLGITLQRVAYDVVNALGYVGALVATCEEEWLALRALYVESGKAEPRRTAAWRRRLEGMVLRPLHPQNKALTRVHLTDPAYADNLSVRAVATGSPVTSHDLYDLVRPHFPPQSADHIGDIQKELGVNEMLAVPFFMETQNGQKPAIVGSLVAGKNGQITEQDKLILAAFGRQAAAAIEIEHNRLKVLQVAKQLTTDILTSLTNEAQILQYIAEGVVNSLGYVGALFATYEEDDSLPIRAFYLDPQVATLETVRQWEKRLSQMLRHPVSLTDPDFARVYVHDGRYRENLSVQAVTKREPVVSNDLFSLFTPVIPSFTRSFINNVVQRVLGIKQVIAVPFFFDPPDNGEPEIVGNLFAATYDSEGFHWEEIELLQAFGRQAAVGIRNAQLYQRAEERREVAEAFGKMAFGAAANVHTLRNHIGAFGTHLQILLMYKNNQEKLQRMLDSSPRYLERLRETGTILDSLHEPWHFQPDQPTDINHALHRAIDKVEDRINLERKIEVTRSFSPDLPYIQTSPDMLVEAFRILIKNGMEAIYEKHDIPINAPKTGNTSPGDAVKLGHLLVESRLSDAAAIEVIVADDGAGIHPSHLTKIFELNWSTKGEGSAFGLFWLRDFVEGLGGSVRVQSMPDEGATFFITLPVPEELLA